MTKNLSNIPLKISYDSGMDDVLWEFYIPVLSLSNHYDRIAGFFSSSSLALAARGLENFISNGGKMRLVTCPQLSCDDIMMLENSVKNLDELLTEKFISDYSQIESQFQKDHIMALGWMLAKDKLEIKIAVIKKNGKMCSADQINELGIMHQKVGIFHDQSGNILSFSGSNNESASGWLGNTEEFKVFCSWSGAIPYIEDDIKKFDSFWRAVRPDVEVKDIPQALAEKLITESQYFEPSMLAIKNYYPNNIIIEMQSPKPSLKLFFYQKEAVEMWEDNERNLLLQMATGCGKTRTAIGCIKNAMEDTSKLLVVIACPQITLASQWKTDIESLDIQVDHSIEINGNVTNWPSLLKREILKLSTGLYRNLVVYSTHQICSSENYINLINDTSDRITKFLIGDEVHGLGAAKTKNGLLERYSYRLGLSATPQRWFDDEGSYLIEKYFGGKSYEFSLEDALKNHNPLTGKPFLVNFKYEPRFISMTEDELEEYKIITDKIIRISRFKSEETYNYLQMMRFKRADIEKNAHEKYRELESILSEIGAEISDTIIFVSADQMDKVMKILGENGISASRFTQAQSTISSDKYGGLSERQYIIKCFKEKKYQVLVAIKCLDEGIDIPSADRAIVMASSTNPREYIQRIGRIIRQAPGKNIANIYDMIIKPDISDFHNDQIIELEKRIFKKEMDRVLELSKNAINNSSVLNEVYSILREVTE
ncbi:DEAD/DEAH box helicase family protein [Clostridia bacterium]|nr:DEAD/DEAH box helicase family protein [Clostridia bacterium]